MTLVPACWLISFSAAQASKDTICGYVWVDPADVDKVGFAQVKTTLHSAAL